MPAVILSVVIHAMALSAYLHVGMTPPDFGQRRESAAARPIRITLSASIEPMIIPQAEDPVPIEVQPEPALEPFIDETIPEIVFTPLPAEVWPIESLPSWSDMPIRPLRPLVDVRAKDAEPEEASPLDSVVAVPATAAAAEVVEDDPSTESASDDLQPQTEDQVTVIAPVPSEENAPPRYPGLARRRGWEGLVVLLVKVDNRGAVTDVSVQTSSGHRVLDQAALDAVRKWHFQPATENGVRIPGETEVAVRYRLED